MLFFLVLELYEEVILIPNKIVLKNMFPRNLLWKISFHTHFISFAY